MHGLLNLSKFQELHFIFPLVNSVVLLGDCTIVYRLAKASGCMRHVIFYLCIEVEDSNNGFKSNLAKEEKPVQFPKSIHSLDSRFPKF